MPNWDEEYWIETGERNPYWGVLAHEKYRGDTLSPDLKSEFYRAGERDIEFALSCIRAHIDHDFRPKRSLDFGCGVGRLVAAMSKHAEHVSGIDVAPTMLEHAGANLRELGISNFALAAELPDGPFDWINSYIVFQHIEPVKGIEILSRLMARLAPAGVVSLHFTIYRDRRTIFRGLQESAYGRFDGRSYVNFERGRIDDMPIYEYDLSEILMHLGKRGIENFFMRHLDHGGSHGVWIFGKSEATSSV